jgi:hypothetical protein
MKFTTFSKQNEIVKDVALDGHKVNVCVSIHKATRNPEMERKTAKKTVVDTIFPQWNHPGDAIKIPTVD